METAFLFDGIDDFIEFRTENMNFNDGLTIDIYGKLEENTNTNTRIDRPDEAVTISIYKGYVAGNTNLRLGRSDSFKLSLTNKACYVPNSYPIALQFSGVFGTMSARFIISM